MFYRWARRTNERCFRLEQREYRGCDFKAIVNTAMLRGGFVRLLFRACCSGKLCRILCFYIHGLKTNINWPLLLPFVTFQGVKKVLYKKKYQSCCWASTYYSPSNVGLILIFASGEIEIRWCFFINLLVFYDIGEDLAF